MKNSNSDKKAEQKENLPGYPHYPANEDIYSNAKEETELNPENPAEKKPVNADPEDLNELDFSEDLSGKDLDIPGAEADDLQEEIGSEDEENNHYSLGGDNHD
jgi:hypothetical protein